MFQLYVQNDGPLALHDGEEYSSTRVLYCTIETLVTCLSTFMHCRCSKSFHCLPDCCSQTGSDLAAHCFKASSSLDHLLLHSLTHSPQPRPPPSWTFFLRFLHPRARLTSAHDIQLNYSCRTGLSPPTSTAPKSHPRKRHM